METPRRSEPLARYAFSDLDKVLGPRLVAHATSAPRRALLSIAVKAVSYEIPQPLVTRWLATRTDAPRLATSPTQPLSLADLWPAAQSFVQSSSLVSRRRRAAIAARQLIGNLLAPAPPLPLPDGVEPWVYDKATDSTVATPPPPLHPGEEVSARHATAVIGLAVIESILEEDMLTVRMSKYELALRMGCSPKTAQEARAHALDLGWVRRVGKEEGQTMRLGLPNTSRTWLTPEAKAIGQAATLAVGALVEQKPAANALAEILALATHIGITYGIGRGPWLYALAQEAEIDVATLGIKRQRGDKEAALWAEVRFEHGADSAPWAEVFDRYAAENGVQARYEKALVRRRAHAEERMKGREEWIETRRKEREDEKAAADARRGLRGEKKAIALQAAAEAGGVPAKEPAPALPAPKTWKTPQRREERKPLPPWFETDSPDARADLAERAASASNLGPGWALTEIDMVAREAVFVGPHFVTLTADFDPNSAADVDLLKARVLTIFGPGWSIGSIDAAGGTATLIPNGATA